MNGTVTLWDVTSHDEIATVHQPELAEEDSEPSTSIHGLAVTHDGGTVITCNSTGRLRFWDVQNQDLIGTATSHDTAMAALAISPDGRTVASGARGAVRLWQLDDRSEIEMLPCDSDRVGALAFSADGVLLAASHDSGVTRIWSTRTWEEVRKFSGDVEEATDALRSAVEPAFEPYSVSFSPDSKALAVPTNRHLVLWKLA